MSWKKHIFRGDKRGGYIVEAAVILPVFILAVIMMMSSIPVISDGENTLFSVSDELRFESVKAALYENQQTMNLRIRNRVMSEKDRFSEFYILKSRYMYTKSGIDDLITVQYQLKHRGRDFMNLFGEAVFDETITIRSYTGTVHQESPITPDKNESYQVYIFPEWGQKYHNETCSYVKGSYQMQYLNDKIKGGYDACRLCDARSAQTGSPVFTFEKYGKVYHLQMCRTVERYYVKIGKYKAEQRGYTPCSKCGG